MIEEEITEMIQIRKNQVQRHIRVGEKVWKNQCVCLQGLIATCHYVLCTKYRENCEITYYYLNCNLGQNVFSFSYSLCNSWIHARSSLTARSSAREGRKSVEKRTKIWATRKSREVDSAAVDDGMQGRRIAQLRGGEDGLHGRATREGSFFRGVALATPDRVGLLGSVVSKTVELSS